MNPAADQDASLAQYLAGPDLLERALTDVRDADLDALPSQGGWTIRQIVHHIVDGDDLWKQGIKAALGNDEGDFSLEWYWTLPQDVWAERWAYASRSLDVSLALFRATRAHIGQLLAHVPEGWHRSVRVRTPTGQTERVSVGFVIQMQADHVARHLERIRAICAERADA
jgi:hypothetical protein